MLKANTPVYSDIAVLHSMATDFLFRFSVIHCRLGESFCMDSKCALVCFVAGGS